MDACGAGLHPLTKISPLPTKPAVSLHCSSLPLTDLAACRCCTLDPPPPLQPIPLSATTPPDCNTLWEPTDSGFWHPKFPGNSSLKSSQNVFRKRFSRDNQTATLHQ